jgi:hypothetical protein
VLRLPRAGDRLVYAGPSNPTARRTLQLRYSPDAGATWTAGPVLHDGPAAYSDLVEAGGRTLGVLYENGDTGTYERITFARVPFATLDRGVAPVATTPDASGGGSDGVVGGTPAVVADGAVGAAVRLAAAGDHVAVPRSARLDVGDGPFTAAGWFRTGVAADQALLWAYNSGSGRDQWWVRLEPGSNRIRALIDTSLGTGTLVAPGSFADGAWHHVALVRGTDGIALYVDGVLVASGAPVAGSVSTDAAVGVHLGQRPDGANQLLGDLDDVWLFDRAASAEEVAALAAGGAVDDPLVHLPLEVITAE